MHVALTAELSAGLLLDAEQFIPKEVRKKMDNLNKRYRNDGYLTQARCYRSKRRHSHHIFFVPPSVSMVVCSMENASAPAGKYFAAMLRQCLTYFDCCKRKDFVRFRLTCRALIYLSTGDGHGVTM